MLAQLKADINNLREIPVILDKSFYLVLVLLPFSQFLFSGVAAGLIAFCILPAIFLFALLHEYGHCWAAQRFGFPVAEIKLWFLGGQAQILSLHETTPKEEAIISIAGPAVNFGLVVVFSVPQLLLGPSLFLSTLVAINLLLGVFNLIPAFPMDGGRILRSFLQFLYKDRFKATKISAYIGIAVSSFMACIGLFLHNFMLILVFAWVGMICYSIIQNDDIIV